MSEAKKVDRISKYLRAGKYDNSISKLAKECECSEKEIKDLRKLHFL